MNREEFLKTFRDSKLGLSVADVDALFKLLDVNGDRLVDVAEWKSRIMENFVSPLK